MLDHWTGSASVELIPSSTLALSEPPLIPTALNTPSEIFTSPLQKHVVCAASPGEGGARSGCELQILHY
ncbi:hypothetical protein EYF80_037974 [Liparis tanakae]|uniref:Uncharacterized protein n=1 Tax=Liparis tanakae TaxID=230148 RepID=A0A4Z2GE00_9TELE|nr:hypothetical protein EYF80_037974 [Liparis tanakae]